MSDVCCPYCGNAQTDPSRCEACGGLFEPLSRQATQLAMGPWFVRDEGKPFMPGFSAEVLKHQVMAGRIKPQTPVRGPTTHQFWVPAIKAPGVSRLLGKCHACAAAVAPHAKNCPKCEADLALPEELDRLGLEFVTDEERRAAQASIAEARRAQPAKPKAAPPQRPVAGGGAGSSAAAVSAGPSAGGAAALQPIPEGVTSEQDTLEPLGPAVDPGDHDDGGYEDDNGIEALWAAAPTRPKRTKRGGPDPMVIGLIAFVLLGVFIAGFFAMDAARKHQDDQFAQQPSDDDDDDAADDGDSSREPDARPAGPTRTQSQVAEAQLAAQSAMDRFESVTVPEVFEENFAVVETKIADADAAQAAGDFSTAFRLYRESAVSANELDLAVGEHLLQMDERERAEALRVAAVDSRRDAVDDDAAQWAPQDWAYAEEALARGDALMESDDADDLMAAQKDFRQAASDYEYARSQSSLGFLAVQAGETLEQAITRTFTLRELEVFGGEAYAQMRALQQRGRGYLEAYSYYDALDAFEIGLLRLDQAERGVKRAHGVKFYAFAAGYSATDALIALAAGDGLSDEKRQLLRESFTDLTLQADVVASLPAGESPDYAACAPVLVTQARDAIALELGIEAQISYNIGFQFRIVQQTLDNPRLSADQTRRIRQTLGLIKTLAGQAGYSRELATRLDAFEAKLRGAEDGDRLEDARTEWRSLIVLLRTYDRAMPIVNPAAGAEPAPDPELFPGSRG